MTKTQDSIISVLLERFGQTYAEQAGITLVDKPSPLYELLVLATLLSAPISAEVGVDAARELFAAGYRTPRRMRDSSRQNRVQALGRGHYRRYDESTATELGEQAEQLINDWHGDLRRLRDEAGYDPRRIHQQLRAFKGIGPTGAHIFLREVQEVWPDIGTYFDQRVMDGAHLLDLPSEPAELASLVPVGQQPVRLASALVRLSRRPKVAQEIKREAGTRDAG